MKTTQKKISKKVTLVKTTITTLTIAEQERIAGGSDIMLQVGIGIQLPVKPASYGCTL